MLCRKGDTHGSTVDVRALDIPNTIAVVSESWREAEEEIRGRIAAHAPRLDETEITSRFHESFARLLDEASGARRVSEAFLKDLRLAALHRNLDEDELRRASRGLVASATLHPGETERRTGGDLGLVIVRPRISREGEGIQVRAQHRRGLLCQAKVRYFRRRWGTLTTNQERVLDDRLAYLGLLLYRYRDPLARELEQFEWQVCNGHTLDDVKHWLRRSAFPKLMSSREILTALSADEIGTSDPQILDQIVAPIKGRCLELRIDWPPGGGPGASVRVLSKSRLGRLEEVRVQVRR